MTIRETLEHRQGFTPAECSIAACLLAHGNVLDRLTIRQLAEETYSANAAVIRLCRRADDGPRHDLRSAHGKDHEAVVKALCTVQKKPMPA